MPRIRTIKPEFWTSEKLATRLPGPEGRQARLLFIGLWNLAEDKTGVTRGNPAFLKGALFVYDDDVTARDVERWLALLEAGGFIVRYQRDGSSYVWVRKFLDHQRIEKPSKATLPEPSEDEKRSSTAVSRSPPGALPEPSRPEVVSSKGREGRGKEPPQPPKGGEEGRKKPSASRHTVAQPTLREPEPAAYPASPPADVLPHEPGPESHGSQGAAWTLPDAVEAVHLHLTGRRYGYEPARDDKAATELMSLASAEGIAPSDWAGEVARRFGRALIRSTWQYERAAGKAVTLRELARRECWRINAEAPWEDKPVRDGVSGVLEHRRVAYDPWDEMLEMRGAA